MNDLSVPADIVGKIGPVLSDNVSRVLLRVADTVSVRSWLSTPIDWVGEGTLYFGLAFRGIGREGGTIDDASDPVELGVGAGVGVGVDVDDEGVEGGTEGESSRTREDEAKDDAS